MRLRITRSGQPIDDRHIEEPVILIGSDAGCSVTLADDALAAVHARLYVEAGAWLLEPLAHEGQIRLNGDPVGEPVELRSGDALQLGAYEIATEFDHVPEPVPVAATGSGAAAPSMSLASMAQFVKFQLPPGSIVRKSDENLTILPGSLTRLGQLNVELGACETVESLMNIVLKALFGLIGAQRAWIGIRRVNYGAMEYVEGRRSTGQPVELTEIGTSLKPRVLDRTQFVLIPLVGPEQPYSVLTGPLLGPDGTLGLVYIDTFESDRRYGQEDLDHLAVLLTLIAAQLDAIFKRLAKARAAMLEGEVAVAHAIQARLTPRKLPQWDELQFGAFREPGRERTSDVYDIVRLGNQTAGVMLAHTLATGPLPGLVFSQTLAAFRSSVMHNDPPHIFLRALNLMLYDGALDRSLDCFAAAIDPPTGELRYSIAGSIGAFIISARGEERRLVDASRPPQIASTKNANYAMHTERLESQETLVLFTPGVVSARNSQGEVFGEDRFINLLCDGFGQLASVMLKEMLSDLQNFTQAGAQPTDITVILAHRP